MATSSITKQFVVKDPEAFRKLMTESARIPERKATQDSPSLNKGREALKRFVLRQKIHKIGNAMNVYLDMLSRKIAVMYDISKEQADYAAQHSAIHALIREEPEYVDRVPLSCWTTII